MAVLLEHPLFLLTLLTLAVFGFVTAAGKKQVHGTLVVKGVSCDYTETGSAGKGKRGIRLCCAGVRKQCEYYGANPHNCGNKYNKNQEKYYKELAKEAMENGAPCAKSSIQESICGLSYPCVSGDCLPSSSNNRNRNRRAPFCDTKRPFYDVPGSRGNAMFPGVSVLLLSCLALFKNI